MDVSNSASMTKLFESRVLPNRCSPNVMYPPGIQCPQITLLRAWGTHRQRNLSSGPCVRIAAPRISPSALLRSRQIRVIRAAGVSDLCALGRSDSRSKSCRLKSRAFPERRSKRLAPARFHSLLPANLILRAPVFPQNGTFPDRSGVQPTPDFTVRDGSAPVFKACKIGEALVT
jgi:hypothetical protein